MMESFEQKIKQILFRHHCPTQMELGEYELGAVDAQCHREIESHVRSCPYCQRDLDRIRSFLVGPESVDVRARDKIAISLVAERVKVFIVNLLSPPPGVLLGPSLQPALRGDEDESRTQVFQIEGFLVSLSVEEGLGQAGGRDLMGDVLSTDRAQVDWKEWRAHLWCAAQLLATVSLDQDGQFRFTGLDDRETPYELILAGPTAEIHLQNLTLS